MRWVGCPRQADSRPSSPVHAMGATSRRGSPRDRCPDEAGEEVRTTDEAREGDGCTPPKRLLGALRIALHDPDRRLRRG